MGHIFVDLRFFLVMKNNASSSEEISPSLSSEAIQSGSVIARSFGSKPRVVESSSSSTNEFAVSGSSRVNIGSSPSPAEDGINEEKEVPEKESRFESSLNLEADSSTSPINNNNGASLTDSQPVVHNDRLMSADSVEVKSASDDDDDDDGAAATTTTMKVTVTKTRGVKNSDDDIRKQCIVIYMVLARLGSLFELKKKSWITTLAEEGEVH